VETLDEHVDITGWTMVKEADRPPGVYFGLVIKAWKSGIGSKFTKFMNRPGLCLDSEVFTSQCLIVVMISSADPARRGSAEPPSDYSSDSLDVVNYLSSSWYD